MNWGSLTKGYWQVPLTAGFSTPGEHWHYRVLPVGLHGAPATFQPMMDILHIYKDIIDIRAYAAAYIDDVAIHSESWDEHLNRLRKG